GGRRVVAAARAGAAHRRRTAREPGAVRAAAQPGAGTGGVDREAAMNWFFVAAVAGASIQVFTAVWAAVTPREGRAPDRLLALLLVAFAMNTLHPVVFGSEGTVVHAGPLLLEP